MDKPLLRINLKIGMKKTRLEISKPDIITFLDKLNKKVIMRKEIESILAKNRQFWRLANSTTTNEFIAFLIDNTKMNKISLNFPFRKEIRFIWGGATTLEIAQTLRPDSYFSHFSAMYIHNLTEQIPKTIYLNYEQTPKKRSKVELEQGRIDNAFKGAPRVSSNIATYMDQRICLLNGMYTNKKGVLNFQGPTGENIFVTDIERTLIDIAVRPIYSGGVFEVLKAYQLAEGKVSINKLAATLRAIGYKYPYHQAIGFYLERAGAYKDSLLDLFRKFEISFDFYLCNKINEKQYSKRWRLYFPKGL